jgi:GT2 family glycosyltransferase
LAGYSVSLSVVTYNNQGCIGKMLDSLYEHTKGVPFHIYAVDNGSTDDTVEIIRAYKDKVTLIENKENTGFGKAHNAVLDKLDSRYHVIINPDVYLDYDVVTAIAEYMDRNDDIGIVSPKVRYPNGEVQMLPKRDPKFRYLLSRRIPFNLFKKYRDEYEMSEKGTDETFDIEFASGCFMFIRTELLKKAGGFDERYFLYFEDADLTRSVRKIARVQYNPQFYIFHSWERGGARSLRLFCIQILSMFKYFKKWKAYRGVK